MQDVADSAAVAATDDDLAAWSRVTLPDFEEDDNYTNNIYLGVFGYDLDKFIDNCNISNYCDYKDFENYDGWAVGMYAFMDETPTLSDLW